MKGKRTIPAEQDPRFEALLTAAAQGLALEQEREADRLFEQLGREPEIESSPEHLADMQSLLQKAKHSKRHSGRGRFLLQWAACLALAACVGSVAFPTQAAAVWQQLRSFVYRQYVTHTEIHISAPESEINTGSHRRRIRAGASFLYSGGLCLHRGGTAYHPVVHGL